MNAISQEIPLTLDANQAGSRSMSYQIADWGLLEVKGPDAEKFLQGQATCDMRQLAERGSLTGAFCNPKGRVLASFKLFAANESIFLRMPRDLIMHMQSILQRYAAFFDVKLHYAHELTGAVLFSGKPIEFEAKFDALGTITGKNSIEIWGDAERVQAILREHVEQFPSANPDWWEANLIKCGEAQIFSLTSEHFLAHQLSLDLSGAISFRKGCYTGQEIIARTQYRGKSKKRLAAAKLTHCENFLPGTEIITLDNIPLGHLLLSISDATSTLIQAVLPEDIPGSGEFMLGPHKTAYEIISTLQQDA